MVRCTWAFGMTVLSLLAFGCGPSVTFTPKEGTARPPQPAPCRVTVFRQRPARDYEVIGVIDIEAFSVRSIPRNEGSFRTEVAPKVCRAGGDAVIPGINGDGRYIQGTVVRWLDRPPGPRAARTECRGGASCSWP